MVTTEPLQHPIDLDDPSLFINRELSWLQFNGHVLEEALDKRHPLLERVKFLSIFASNLDEFFMLRVSGLRRQLESGVLEAPPDGMTPSEQLAEIRKTLIPQLDTHVDCYKNDLMPALAEAGLSVLPYDHLKRKQRKLLRRHFKRQIFPALTPLAFDPGRPFPHIANLSMNLAVLVNDSDRGELFARLKVPAVFPRLLRVPSEEKADSYENLGLVRSSNTFVWIEEVIAANLDMLFPGVEIVAAYPFRLTRDADVEIEEDEAADLSVAVERWVGRRRFGSADRLEIDQAMPEWVRSMLIKNLGLAPYQVFAFDGPLGLTNLMELTQVDRPDLKDEPFKPSIPPALAGADNVFAAIRQQNVILYHPYDSFMPVVDFLRQAARDPKVLAIKQTLYRIGSNSPIVDALLEAREDGRQVSVLVELKARFDEENNLGWARALEKAGVHVVYGLVGLKTHAKMTMVVRRESTGLRRYVHLGTGNYNLVTARVYSDFGLFTIDEDIAEDVSELFNVLTGYAHQTKYRKLLVAPTAMRTELLERIEREAERHRTYGDGYLAFKMNALVDKQIIQALYRASQAGVKIDLQVRGICALRPGIPGVSSTISVTSIVGRFLEHTRIYYFHNGGQEELFLGSADLMPRNLDRRVELLFPLEGADLILVRDAALAVHLKDTAQARILQTDGSYRRAEGDGFDSQQWMLDNWGFRGSDSDPGITQLRSPA
ncbi:MAG TPA: polyphosphate kinase 1 [Actinobacteria bacterium]|nr:polyphosphate kinase [bacterium BMS3Bbin01]HDH26801.1 polyphosphate kinase 1 [Actinomycetota bacterium]